MNTTGIISKLQISKIQNIFIILFSCFPINAQEKKFVEVNGDWCDSKLYVQCILPKEEVRLRVFAFKEDSSQNYERRGNEWNNKAYYRFPMSPESLSGWVSSEFSWKAPEKPGVYTVFKGGEKVIDMIVLLPSDSLKNGVIGGYKIGEYPKGPHGFAIPEGFILVTEENKNTPVSEHFKLSDFLCRDGVPLPKYIALNMELIQKLEILIAKLSSEGHKCSGLKIISGFRTPLYNKKRRAAKESQHMYGEAADVIVDENDDWRMDDLNKDGKIDRKDAEILAKSALQLNEVGIYVGGYAAYPGRRRRGPFVHVDTRGKSVTWKTWRKKYYRRHRKRVQKSKKVTVIEINNNNTPVLAESF